MSNTFEILARGRSPFDGEWYEGDVSRHKNGSVSIRPIENNPTGTGYYVEAETVTPYVQRTDKNGKKVFLGDILIRCGIDDGEEYADTFFVGYDDENGAFVIDGKRGQFLPNKETFLEECEIIGNCFENLTLFESIKDFYRKSEVAQ